MEKVHVGDLGILISLEDVTPSPQQSSSQPPQQSLPASSASADAPCTRVHADSQSTPAPTRSHNESPSSSNGAPTAADACMSHPSGSVTTQLLTIPEAVSPGRHGDGAHSRSPPMHGDAAAESCSARYESDEEARPRVMPAHLALGPPGAGHAAVPTNHAVSSNAFPVGNAVPANGQNDGRLRGWQDAGLAGHLVRFTLCLPVFGCCRLAKGLANGAGKMHRTASGKFLLVIFDLLGRLVIG